MKTLTVRLPEALVANIEAESRERGIAKSDVVRERLQRPPPRAAAQGSAPYHPLADLIGAIDGLPADLSANRKRALKATGYGRKRSR